MDRRTRRSCRSGYLYCGREWKDEGMDESAGQREAEDNGERNERESRKSQDVTEWKEGTELN
jgi:hypothetical protein